MLLNYFIIAARNFTKRKFFSLINAFGLSLAISFSLLVFYFIMDEISFDQFHANKEFIYRINKRQLNGLAFQNQESEPYQYSAVLPNALAVAIQEQAPDAALVTLLKTGGKRPLGHADKIFEQDIHFTDSSFFRMFSFPVLTGSTHSLFRNHTDAVITSEVATRYFGDSDPIGKTFFLDYDETLSTAYTVRAVVECPPNSSIQFDVLLPLESYKPYNVKAWNINSYGIFVQLTPKANPITFLQTINDFITHYRGDWVRSVQDYYKLPPDMLVEEYTLTALEDIHFDKAVAWTNVSDPRYSWILGSMAVLIILIASINYISFSLTLSASRRKEIGIRKVIGATGTQIFNQFNIESITLCLLGAFIGFVIAVAILPLFNYFTQKQIQLADMPVLLTGVFLVFIALVTGLLAGSYPSLFVARLKPVMALKGTATRQPFFIRPLVVLQFVMSAFLIISSVIMYRQMRFIATKDLGFSEDNLISVQTHMGWGPESDQAIERFRTATLGNPDIVGVSGASGSFIRGSFSRTYKVNDREHVVYFCRVDPDYLSVLNIELIEGRNFALVGDSSSIIVNEALVRDMGWSDPLQEIYSPEGPNTPGYRVIGVVKDYHFLSLEEEIQPLYLSASESTESYLITLLIKLNGENLPQALATAEKEWKKLYPDKPFDYTFADVELARHYDSYTRWTKIAGTTALLSIIIAGLGMFGLAGIAAASRTKEIGIRKILGADLNTIFLLVNRPFILLAVLAFVIATPFSWYAMHEWVENFTYRITIGWEIFFIGMISGLFIALISVSYHGIKTAQLNPADTLRSE